MPITVNANSASANVQHPGSATVQGQDIAPQRSAAGASGAAARRTDAVTLSPAARAAPQEQSEVPRCARFNGTDLLSDGNSMLSFNLEPTSEAKGAQTAAAAPHTERQPPPATEREPAPTASEPQAHSDRPARQLAQEASSLNSLGTNEAALQSAEDSAESDRVTAAASQDQANDAEAAELSAALRQEHVLQQAQLQAPSYLGRAQAAYSSLYSATAIRRTASS